MTGASGAVYGVRLLEVLLSAGCTVHLAVSPAAARVIEQELGRAIDLSHFERSQLLGDTAGEPLPRPPASAGTSGRFEAAVRGRIVYHHFQDYGAPIASGSFRTGGMVICPCSMGTLAAVANGLSANLIHRAADVHLKERRRLVVVPRETPLGTIQLENMRKLSEAGGVVLPAMPGFYHNPTTVAQLVDFVVARICDQLSVPVELTARWGEPG